MIRTPNINHIGLCRSANSGADPRERRGLALLRDGADAGFLSEACVEAFAVSDRSDTYYAHCSGGFKKAVAGFQQVVRISRYGFLQKLTTTRLPISGRHNHHHVKFADKAI